VIGYPRQEQGGCVFCCLPLLLLFFLGVLLALLLGASWVRGQ
jgi:hypothetical protein